MNPVYNMKESRQPESRVQHSRALQILVIDSRICLLDSLAQAIGNTKDISVRTAGTTNEGREKYLAPKKVYASPGNKSVKTTADDHVTLHVGAYCEVPGPARSVQLKPFDIVLYCVGGNSADTVAADLEALGKDFGQASVVVISERLESFDTTLIDKGLARNIVPAAYSTTQLVNCLWLISSGVQFLPAELRHASLSANPDMHGAAVSRKLEKKLTPRQLEVLEYVSLGKSNKYIAAELSLCESTVKVHVHEVMKRLGATSRTHASYIVNTLYRSNQVDEHDARLVGA